MNKCSECGEAYDGAEVFCPKDGTRLGGKRDGKKVTVPPEADPFIGKVVQDRYRVIEQLGEGGMGVVYTAEHVEIEKIVALKILRDDFSKRPEVVERFRQEARAASRIGHPNIVDVTDFGQLEDGGVYFVMEHLKGIGLCDLISRQTLPLERAVPIITQIAKALEAAHGLGIVHRDLKPENIFLVERDGSPDFVKILDFGIAKISDRDSEGERLTKTGMIFGTPEYMSPEQAAGKELDHRVDIYALGCIMFEMYTGQVPYDGESFMAVLTQHMFEPVPSIESIVPDTPIPESVRSVVYKAMAKEPDERYSEMNGLLEDLARAVADVGFVADVAGRETTHRLATAKNRAIEGGSGGGSRTELDWSQSSDGIAADHGKSRRVAYIGIALAVILIGGGLAAFFGLRGDREQEAPRQSLAALRAPAAEETEKPVIAAESAAPEKPVEEVATPEPEPVAPPEPQKLVVRIESKPEKAVISIEGLGQVCSAAPCELPLEMGQPVDIEARLGDSTAKMTFTPSEQNKQITLEIPEQKPAKRKASKPRRKTRESRPKQEPKQEPKSENRPSELKIPGIFKDR